MGDILSHSSITNDKYMSKDRYCGNVDPDNKPTVVNVYYMAVVVKKMATLKKRSEK
mgnify:CR=1 FL=1